MSELEFWKDLGNIFDAVMNYQKKNVEFNNNFINPWIRLGNIFERQDQSNDAVQAYQRATEIDPNTAQNWINLGDAQFKKGAYDEGIEAYRKAVMLDPEAGWPVGNLALSLVTQGKTEEAIPLYKKSIELLADAKDKAICWNRLGNAYRKLNDYENAFLAFQKADQLDGGNTGFDDTLDETLPSISVVAPEEILDQMSEDQALEEKKAEPAPLEVVNESVQETSQPDAAPATVPFIRVETPDRRIALAPNMEMVVDENITNDVVQPLNEASVEVPTGENAMIEEETPLSLHEKNFDILQVVEDVIAKVEQAFSEKQSSETAAVQVIEEIPAETEPSAMGEEASLEVEVPVVAEAAIEEIASATAELPEFNDDPEPEVEAIVASDVNEEKPRRIPAWLVMNVEEKETAAKTEAQEELVQVESTTTLSSISQEVAVNELIVNMDVVETYTDPLAAQLTTDSNLSQESLPEAVDQTQGGLEREAEIEEQETIALNISNLAEESVAAQEPSTADKQELAYEEYLKDVVEPTKILTDHVDEIQSEVPITKVSKNGDVRIVMDTKNAHVWNELGNIYLNAGSYDDAIASYSKAIELDRNFAWPYSNLALAYVQKERFAEAILFYQRGIELFTSDKDKAITWNRLGNVYRRINDYSTAIASYQTADELDPENATLSLRSSFGLLGNKYSDSKPAYVA